MKIRTRLTLRYTIATTAIVSALVATVLLVAAKNREAEFYDHLRGEALTKAHLFLNGNVDAGTMHDIYMNNREFIHEVEVAVYKSDHELVYHDATDIDIVKETPRMLDEILYNEGIEFYQDKYQVVGMVYDMGGERYIVTAAAYDGYGYATLKGLTRLVLTVWIIGMVLLAIVGYYMAKKSLSAVTGIVEKVGTITGSSLADRIEVENPGDELGELAGTFNDMLDRLEVSFDNQRMFVSNISHELRTPLAALIAELEVTLMRERTGEEYREAIGHGLSDARRIVRLSSGLLDLARADYAPERISFREVRLDELLLDAREMVIKASPGYRVEMIFDQTLDDERYITISGNEYLLRTAFVNLIENNCKFSGDNTCHINISYYGDHSYVRFSDTGTGLSREETENMFRPFYRGGNSAGTAGHGIGMALVKKIIDLHGGTIEVNSHPGEGTVFICRFGHI